MSPAGNVTRDEVERYLSFRLGGVEVRVTSMHQTFPGQSQETWLIEANIGDDSAEAHGFVLRVNPPGGGIVPLPLRREYEVYVRLARTTIPVAKPLWFDHDPSWFGGRPCYVRDLVPGSTHVSGLHEVGSRGDELRRAVAFEHAEQLARIHTLDWAAAGFAEILDVPASVVDAPRLEFETWRTVWDEVRIEPFPMVTEALHWFEANLPKSAPRISLCKGNNGLGEEIWRGERIVALSDWELASLGDPAQDWAFSQGLLDLWDREETLAHYEAAAGFSLPRENLAFWTVWTIFKSICCTRAGLRGYLDGRDRRAVLPTIGFGSVKLAEGFLAVVVDLDVESAASLIAAMGKQRLADPAAAGMD